MKKSDVKEYMESNKQSIINDYLSGFGGWDLYLKYGVSGNCIVKYLREWGISIRNSSETKALDKPMDKECLAIEESKDGIIKVSQKLKGSNKRKGIAWSKINNDPELRQKHQALKQHVSKLKKRCGLCGETNSDVLLFHHIDPSIKSDEVSNMVNHLMPMCQIRAEIAKCVVVCFNCHHIIHRKEYADIFDEYANVLL